MRAEAGHDAARDHFEDAAQRVALLSRLIDERDHSLLGIVIRAVQRCVVGDRGDLVPVQLEWSSGNAAELDYVTAHFDGEHRQQLFCQRAAGYARGSFASGSTFEDVAQIANVVFEPTGKIGVTGTWTFEA